MDLGNGSLESGKGGIPPKPTGLQQLLLRLPAYLYRLRLGWLLGKRFLLLRHRGRLTGRTYCTVLEVIRHDPSSEESVVVSAWGDRADWYRNIRANPPLDVETGSRRYVPVVRFLGPEHGYQELTDYVRRHPRAARFLLGLIGHAYDGSEDGRRKLASILPLVSFRPQTELGVDSRQPE